MVVLTLAARMLGAVTPNVQVPKEHEPARKDMVLTDCIHFPILREGPKTCCFTAKNNLGKRFSGSVWGWGAPRGCLGALVIGHGGDRPHRSARPTRPCKRRRGLTVKFMVLGWFEERTT